MGEFGEIVVELLSIAIRWLAGFFGNMAQGIAGFIFSCMDVFLDANANGGTTVVEQVLEPIYNFSMENFTVMGIMILVLLTMFYLICIMWGKFSAVDEDPIVLVVRAAFFSFLIMNSALIIKTISSDLLMPAVEYFANVEVSLDKEAEEGFKKGSDNAFLFIENTFGVELSKENLDSSEIQKKNEDSSDDNESNKENNSSDDKKKKPNNKNNTSDEITDVLNKTQVISESGLGMGILSYATGGNALYGVLIAIILYVAVWGVLVLIMAFKALGICWRLVQRLVSFFVVLYMAPLALAAGAAKGTQRIFSEWLRMLASYGITILLTAGFMRVTQEVIYRSFYYAGQINVICAAFVFGIAIALIELINQLEQYVDKLGLTAVGWNSKNMASMIVSQVLTRALGNMLSGGKMSGKVASGSTSKGGGNILTRTASKMSISRNKAATAVKDTMPTVTTGHGKSSGIGVNAGKVGKNARNLIKGNGNLIKDKSGTVRAIDPKSEVKDGKIKTVDGFKVDANAPRFKDISDISSLDESKGEKIAVNGKDGMYGSYTGVARVSGMGAKENAFGSGKYVMAQTNDGKNVAIDKTKLEKGLYSKVTEDGKPVMKEYDSKYSREMYALTKDGSYVKMSDNKTYDLVGGDEVGASRIDFITSDKHTHALNGNDGSCVESYVYSDNLNANTKLIDTSRIESFRQLNESHMSDGSVVGIFKQRLDDGTSCFREYKLVPNNEVHVDYIDSILSKNPADPCTGYTLDGKYFMVAGEVIKGNFLDDIKRRFKG